MAIPIAIVIGAIIIGVILATVYYHFWEARNATNVENRNHEQVIAKLQKRCRELTDAQQAANMKIASLKDMDKLLKERVKEQNQQLSDLFAEKAQVENQKVQVENQKVQVENQKVQIENEKAQIENQLGQLKATLESREVELAQLRQERSRPDNNASKPLASPAVGTSQPSAPPPPVANGLRPVPSEQPSAPTSEDPELDWQTRLNEAFRLLESSDGSSMVPVSGSASNHGQLAQTFAYLKTQSFRTVADEIVESLPKDPTVTVWTVKQMLAEEILGKGSLLLAQALLSRRQYGELTSAVFEREQLKNLCASVVKSLVAGLQVRGMPAISRDLRKQVDLLVTESLSFVQDLLRAAPPGHLIFVAHEALYDPTYHAPLNDGCTLDSEARIAGTIFPGYVIRQIAVKAEVRIEQKTKAQ